MSPHTAKESLALRLLRIFRRPFAGLGLRRIPGVAALFRLVYRAARPRGLVKIEHRGVSLWIDSSDDGVAAPLLIHGTYEQGEIDLLLGRLATGMTVVDGGANVGLHTLLISRAVGPEGRVFAFEPEPRNFDLLRRNVEESGCTNVELRQAALGAAPGRLPLTIDRVNWGAHSLCADAVERGGETLEVEVVTLDEAVGREAAVDLIKLDVQGAEGFVLDGAAGVIERHRPDVLLEFWPWGLERAGADPLALLDRFTRWGYAVSEISEDGEALPVTSLPSLLERCAAEAAGRGHLNLLLTSPAGG